jgi:alpha-glucosidase (family GH31 glycosyl hydrolase)
MYLNDSLVAPIWNSDNGKSNENVSTRMVWIPPGSWTDAWSGASITGPKSVTVSQPVERIPLWHKAGGLTILASEPALRVDDQDWGELTLEAFRAGGESAIQC